MGMIAYTYEDQEVVGNYLTAIFFSMLFIFIFITVLLYFKMRNTFRIIMYVQLTISAFSSMPIPEITFSLIMQDYKIRTEGHG